MARTIPPDIWTDETFGELEIATKLLLIGLISIADDQGRSKVSIGIVRSKILPFEDFTIDDITEMLDSLHLVGLVIVYEYNEGVYLQIAKWWDWQQLQWAYPSEIPPPNGWRDSLRYRKKGQVITENWPEPTSRQYPKNWEEIKRSVFKRDGTTCIYCIDTRGTEVDHIIPVSKGGTHELNNLIVCCTRCNSSKNDQDMEEWFKKQPFFNTRALDYIATIQEGDYAS